jgi:hypothetical protein
MDKWRTNIDNIGSSTMQPVLGRPMKSGYCRDAGDGPRARFLACGWWPFTPKPPRRAIMAALAAVVIAAVAAVVMVTLPAPAETGMDTLPAPVEMAKKNKKKTTRAQHIHIHIQAPMETKDEDEAP